MGHQKVKFTADSLSKGVLSVMDPKYNKELTAKSIGIWLEAGDPEHNKGPLPPITKSLNSPGSLYAKRDGLRVFLQETFSLSYQDAQEALRVAAI